MTNQISVWCFIYSYSCARVIDKDIDTPRKRSLPVCSALRSLAADYTTCWQYGQEEEEAGQAVVLVSFTLTVSYMYMYLLSAVGV